MRWLLCLLSLAALSYSQNPETAVFPSSVATDSDLLVAKDDAWSVLSSSIDETTLNIPVANASRFIYPSSVKIESELIKICNISGNTLIACSGGRGFGGTTAAKHSSGVIVEDVITAKHHNLLAAEIKAIEEALGPDLSHPINKGTSLPTSCSVGDLYFKTDATPGENIYLCTSENTWTQVQTGSSNSLTIENEFSTQGAVPVAAAGSGRAVVESPLVVDAESGSMTINSSNPTELTLKNHSSTMSAPSSSGLTKLGISSTGTLVTRTYGGNELEYSTTDHSHAWGSITGTLSNQTDLQSALDAKVSSVSGTSNEITSSGGTTPTLSIADTFRITGKTATAPVKAGATLPSTCTVGDLFYKTDATAGQNLYGCTSTDTWTQLGGSVGSSTPTELTLKNHSSTMSAPSSSGLTKLGISSTGTLVTRTYGGNELEYSTTDHSHAWGSITGTLSNQTDLQSALDAKVSSVSGTSNEITSSGGTTPTLSIADTFRITGKTATAPVKAGTTLPSTCTVGDLFYKTDATAGQNLYGCTSTDTWTQLGSSTFLGLSDTPSSYTNYGLYPVRVNSSANALEFDDTMNVLYWEFMEQFTGGVRNAGYQNGAMGNVGWFEDKFGSASANVMSGDTYMSRQRIGGSAYFSTGTTSDSYVIWRIPGQNTDRFASWEYLRNEVWEINFVVRVSSDWKSGVFVMGFGAKESAADTDGRIAVVGRTGTTNWRYEVCSTNTTCDSVDSKVAVNTTWRRFRIRRAPGDAAGKFRFCYDACTTEVTINTSHPANYSGGHLLMKLYNTAASLNEVTVDRVYGRFRLQSPW